MLELYPNFNMRALVMIKVVSRVMDEVEKEVETTQGTTSMSGRGAIAKTKALVKTTEMVRVESAKES